MPLEVSVGHATSAGVRPANEDFVGLVTPVGDELARKGVIAVIADGVSGHSGGREAAEYTGRGVLTDYYATPDTWEVTLALDRVLQAINRWVIAQAQARREIAGMATTLTALVVRGRRMVIAHVGDTRAYRLRAGSAIERLTTDHVWDRPDMSHVLTRAVGLDPQLRLDFHDDELRVADRFVLVSDGVWATLNDARLASAAERHADPQALADALVALALSQGSQDNASAVVLDIVALPDDQLGDVLAASASLQVPRALRVGDTLDDFQVLEVIHHSAATIVYRVEDRSTGRQCVLKTLTPERGEDPAERRQLAHEEWLAKRAVARFFPQVIPVGPERRSALYYVQTWHSGHTLATALSSGQHFTVPEVLAIAIKLTRGVGALHRRSIIHRDLKPENVHLGEDDEVRILDLGVAESGFVVGTMPSRAGTPSFLAPELIAGDGGSVQTDLFALGVTLYFALTRRYPYGEIEPFQRPRFGDPITPTRYRPDIPSWLENVVLKAVAREQKHRFETAEELFLALERGAARPIEAPGPTPLLARDAATIWRAVGVVSIVVNLLLAYLILVGR